MDNYGYDFPPDQQVRLPGQVPFGRGRGIVNSEAYQGQGSSRGPRHPPPPFQPQGRGFSRPPPPPSPRGAYQYDSYRQRGIVFCFLEWQPCHSPAMVFWLFRAVKPGFS